jgi:hypothetical protein
MILFILCLTLIFLGILYYLYKNNTKLTQEIELLREVLSVKETTITNLEASRVSVKDVIENFSSHEKVMHLLDKGLGRDAIAKQLDIPLNKVELMIKFDKIKKDKKSVSK